jgi:hypothetical protein
MGGLFINTTLITTNRLRGSLPLFGSQVVIIGAGSNIKASSNNFDTGANKNAQEN